MSIIDIFEQNGVEFIQEGNSHCRPGWIQTDCPFCSSRGAGKYHLGFNLAKGYFSCWRCRGHRTADTLVELIGCDSAQAEKLARVLSSDDSLNHSELKSKRGNLILPKPLRELGRSHKEYLHDRGLSDSRIALYQLQATGPYSTLKFSGKRVDMRWRVFIPYLRQGEIVSYTCRTILPNVEQRYIGAPAECEAIDRKTLLFGEDFAAYAVCAVEGEFDAMKCGPGFVAVGGTAYKKKQLLRLAKYPVRAVWFDNEPAAQQVAREMVDMLSVYEGKTYLISSDSKDPGCAPEKEISRVRKALRL